MRTGAWWCRIASLAVSANASTTTHPALVNNAVNLRDSVCATSTRAGDLALAERSACIIVRDELHTAAGFALNSAQVLALSADNQANKIRFDGDRLCVVSVAASANWRSVANWVSVASVTPASWRERLWWPSAARHWRERPLSAILVSAGRWSLTSALVAVWVVVVAEWFTTAWRRRAGS